MVVDISTKYDKMLGHLKAEREFSSKAEVVQKIVEVFFKKNMELD
jgi:hypothetical protein